MFYVKCEMLEKEGRWKNFVFDFEKLEVYQLAVEFVHKLIEVVKNLTSDLSFSLGGNVIRAGMSILNNIAESSGKKSPKEKKRYYGTSLDSARECIPTITVIYREGCINEKQKDGLRGECLKICNKMGKLISLVEK